MKIKKCLMLGFLIWGIFVSLIGISLAFLPKTYSTIIGIVIIILSLMSGLILQNPISAISLGAGICVHLFPPYIMGIVFIIVGLAAMTVSGLLWFRNRKPSSVS